MTIKSASSARTLTFVAYFTSLGGAALKKHSFHPVLDRDCDCLHTLFKNALLIAQQAPGQLTGSDGWLLNAPRANKNVPCLNVPIQACFFAGHIWG